MKEFEIDVIQTLEGNYKGKMIIEAKNKKELLIKLANLTEEEIEHLVDSWETENFVGVGKHTFENIQEL